MKEEVVLREPQVEMEDLTESVCWSLTHSRVKIIRNATVYSTDRAENHYHPGYLNKPGNSEVEAGHTFLAQKVFEKMGCETNNIRMSINNIRIYGRIPAKNTLHYHGYSKKHKEALGQVNQFIIFVVNALGSYTDRTISILEKGQESTELHKTAFIFEDEGQIKVKELSVGDMLILPTGISHTFAATDDTFASYSVIEIASDANVMYQTHWYEDEGEGNKIQELIQRTVNKENQAGTQSLDLSSISKCKIFVTL
jgi:hypothetical protein